MKLTVEEKESVKMYCLDNLSAASKFIFQLKNYNNILDLFLPKYTEEEFEERISVFNEDKKVLKEQMRNFRKLTCLPNHPNEESCKLISTILGSQKSNAEIAKLANEIRQISSDEIEIWRDEVKAHRIKEGLDPKTTSSDPKSTQLSAKNQNQKMN